MKEKMSYAKIQLTDALLDLLRTKRLNEISISELCDKAQLSRLSFYRNYSSLEDILKRHLSMITSVFLENAPVNFRSTSSEQFINTVFEHLLDHKELIDLLFQNKLDYLLKEEFDAAFSRSVKDHNDIYRCYIASGAYFNLFYYWFVNGCLETPAELSRLVQGFHL